MEKKQHLHIESKTTETSRSHYEERRLGKYSTHRTGWKDEGQSAKNKQYSEGQRIGGCEETW